MLERDTAGEQADEGHWVSHRLDRRRRRLLDRVMGRLREVAPSAGRGILDAKL